MPPQLHRQIPVCPLDKQLPTHSILHHLYMSPFSLALPLASSMNTSATLNTNHIKMPVRPRTALQFSYKQLFIEFTHTSPLNATRGHLPECSACPVLTSRKLTFVLSMFTLSPFNFVANTLESFQHLNSI